MIVIKEDLYYQSMCIKADYIVSRTHIDNLIFTFIFIKQQYIFITQLFILNIYLSFYD